MVRDDYDSGRTNLGVTGPDAGNEPQEFFDGLEQAMTTHGSQDSMNMNNMLLTNIRVSDYFKLLSEKRTFEEVVDEIYYNVKSAVPWVPGTHNVKSTNGMCGAVRGVSAAGRPTSCFTLVYKCFCLKLTASQINTLINHPDSPYIRIVGFLYLRFCCKPDKLWGWYEQYLDDEEEFYVQGEKYGEGDKTTFGPWLRLLLTEMDYHETRLPRIPSGYQFLPPRAGVSACDARRGAKSGPKLLT
jgi:pre-mRNA-splicing factor 38B